METTNLLWMTGGLAFFTGLVMGIVINHLLGGSQSQSTQIRKQLEETKVELNDYREKVTNHFSTTARLINQMTESYRDVHEHMATSANELCTNELTCQRLNDSLLNNNSLPSDSNAKKSQNAVEPPKDYALKKDSEETGTLADNYGLDTNKKTLNDA